MDVLESLSQRLTPPACVFLSGSRARGDNKADSDWDLIFYALSEDLCDAYCSAAKAEGVDAEWHFRFDAEPWTCYRRGGGMEADGRFSVLDSIAIGQKEPDSLVKYRAELVREIVRPSKFNVLCTFPSIHLTLGQPPKAHPKCPVDAKLFRNVAAIVRWIYCWCMSDVASIDWKARTADRWDAIAAHCEVSAPDNALVRNLLESPTFRDAVCGPTFVVSTVQALAVIMELAGRAERA
jgi:hypothetical protein